MKRLALIGFFISQIACGNYDTLSHREKEEITRDISLLLEYKSSDYMAIYSFLWISGEVVYVVEETADDGMACLNTDNTVLYVRRPVKSFIVTDDQNECEIMRSYSGYPYLLP